MLSKEILAFSKNSWKNENSTLNLSGFNLEKAFDSVVEQLDYLHDYSVKLAYKIREMGLQSKFEKNGNLIYHKNKISLLNPKHLSSNIKKTFYNLSNNTDDVFIFGEEK